MYLTSSQNIHQTDIDSKYEWASKKQTKNWKTLSNCTNTQPAFTTASSKYGS